VAGTLSGFSRVFVVGAKAFLVYPWSSASPLPPTVELLHLDSDATQVLCIAGDGSAMYTIQALWTAAHAGIPVVVAVVNNRQYAILKLNLASSGGRSAAEDNFVGMDLDTPPIDYVGLARSMGVEAHLVEKPDDVTEATRAAIAADRPVLLALPISAP
jgi:Thiamine pyrophosphate-requiring enzymes [acetolactate synthase, pyruvate dehydrogenase (cytochrome), glyoxylate carboligase, phosphonopyruvate decarboxylase]